MPVVRTDGRAGGRSMYGHVIAKFSWMGSLPHFLTHGAPLPPTRALPALRARELRYKKAFLWLRVFYCKLALVKRLSFYIPFRILFSSFHMVFVAFPTKMNFLVFIVISNGWIFTRLALKTNWKYLYHLQYFCKRSTKHIKKIYQSKLLETEWGRHLPQYLTTTAATEIQVRSGQVNYKETICDVYTNKATTPNSFVSSLSTLETT